MSANPLLSIEGLTASVDEKTILHNVNLNVAAGETHVLMGPNGAGKSTLGHLVMGDPVYTVNDGRIVFDGQDITELTTDKRSRAGLFLSFQAPVEIPGVPLSSFLRASIAGRPGLEMKGKEFYFILTAAEESVPMMERTVECFRGFLDCLEGPTERGVVYGVGAWHAGEIESSPAMQEAYELGLRA